MGGLPAGLARVPWPLADLGEERHCICLQLFLNKIKIAFVSSNILVFIFQEPELNFFISLSK